MRMVAPGVGPLVGSGGAGRGAIGGLRWRREWAPVAPEVGSGGTGRGADLHPVEVP